MTVPGTMFHYQWSVFWDSCGYQLPITNYTQHRQKWRFFGNQNTPRNPRL